MTLDDAYAGTTVTIAGRSGLLVDLPALFGQRVQQLPVVLRLLLENVLRCCQGSERRDGAAAILAWLDHGTSQAEIAFQPGRVLMHDTTSTPALVDIAAMREALHEAGVDPTLLNPVLPVDVSVDHSLAVEAWGRRDAPQINLTHEMRRNAERYTFLRWAAQALRGVRIHPPGTGIMHTINLEQLATVVSTEQRGGQTWFVPDMMVGTDSHTPMINGIGVLGWGVGGLEAQTVMFGLPTLLRIPDVVGVRLSGSLPPAVLATDLALVVTQRLRALGVTGDFVEFFGPGVTTLTAGARAVVANMAPEYGATTGFFAIDAQTLIYLRGTGRGAAHLSFIEAYARRVGLWFEQHATPRYSRVVEIELSQIGMHIAGPQRPQDLLLFSQARATLEALHFKPQAAAGELPQHNLPPHPVAIAAITSCTNTSDPSLLLAAGLLARKARRLGLSVPHWVRTSLAPGSPAAAAYLERSGLMADLAAVGFDIVGYGCTTCIGTPGPLPEMIRAASAAGTIRPVAVLSGNRNFPGRVHPDLDLGFLMSPPLVVAFALAGDAQRNFSREPVQRTVSGQAVSLQELWPTHEEIAAALALAIDPADYQRAFAVASHNPAWEALAAPPVPRYPWNAASTALRRPPFAASSEGSLLGHYTAYPLLVLGDDVTTDHLSPASAIPPDSLVADFLVARGEDRNDLNVFASRRGNWEVMLRAAFHNKTLRNLLHPDMPVAHTLHVPSGEVVPIWQAAQRYRDAGDAVVLVAGERYGTSSSRDWAAKGQRLLGIRAVLAQSFERIHRSNLIGMGVLPLCLPAQAHPAVLKLVPGDRIEVDAMADALTAGCTVQVRVLRAHGAVQAFSARADVQTRLECEQLREGGVMPMTLRRLLREHAPVS